MTNPVLRAQHVREAHSIPLRFDRELAEPQPSCIRFHKVECPSSFDAKPRSGIVERCSYSKRWRYGAGNMWPYITQAVTKMAQASLPPLLDASIPTWVGGLKLTKCGHTGSCKLP